MKLVFTHPNSMIVGNMAGLLAQSGIETQIRNEFLGGASGELAPGETWIELWVIDDPRAAEATQVIKAAQAQHDEDDWHCQACSEANPPTFEFCWHCGQPAA